MDARVPDRCSTNGKRGVERVGTNGRAKFTLRLQTLLCLRPEGPDEDSSSLYSPPPCAD